VRHERSADGEILACTVCYGWRRSGSRCSHPCSAEPRHTRMFGYTYAVVLDLENPHILKIGRADRLRDRMLSLDSLCWRPLRVVGLAQSRSFEHVLHRALRHVRVRATREFFDLSRRADQRLLVDTVDRFLPDRSGWVWDAEWLQAPKRKLSPGPEWGNAAHGRRSSAGEVDGGPPISRGEEDLITEMRSAERLLGPQHQAAFKWAMIHQFGEKAWREAEELAEQRRREAAA